MGRAERRGVAGPGVEGSRKEEDRPGTGEGSSEGSREGRCSQARGTPSQGTDGGSLLASRPRELGLRRTL